MKSVVILISLIVITPCLANTLDSSKVGRTAFAVSAGTATEDINWTINAPNTTVNVISELDYRNVESDGISFDFNYHFKPKWSFASKLHIATITAGTVRDSDYCNANRTEEFSQSLSMLSGERIDYNFFLQHQLLSANGLSFKLNAGYALHQQNLTMTRGIQTIYEVSADLNCDPDLIQTVDLAHPFPLSPADLQQLNSILQNDLNSTFDQSWRGPWIGFAGSIENNTFVLRTNLNYYFAQVYNAQAYWNLRNFPYSFNSHASGITIQAYVGVKINKQLELGLSNTYYSFKSSGGNEVLVSSDCDGLPVCAIGNNFNGARWQSENLIGHLRLSLRYSKF